MPGNKVLTRKKLQSRKGSAAASKLHPESRRAKQLQRIELRESKLALKNKVRRVGETHGLERHVHFASAVPDERQSLSLPEMHELVREYLSRFVQELASLAEEREGRKKWRKGGEGKSKRELELDGIMEREAGEYRSGFLIPDLTLEENVSLCRQWVDPSPNARTTDGEEKLPIPGDPSFFPRIRLVRITRDDENSVVVERHGARGTEWGAGQGEVEMADKEEEEEE